MNKIYQFFIRRDENFWLLIFFILFIFIRRLHFAEFLNFSTDQAIFSIKALEIWRLKKLTLIGPSFSINFDGRYAFQGPAIYYFQLLFLLIGQFDPVVSSYAFMLFCAAMILPLYCGMKNLTNKNSAFLVLAVYSFLPFFIDYTRFLWNPNFQLALFPFLVYFTSKFCQTKKRWWFFVMSIWLGFLLQFHYQFVLIIVAYFLFFFFHYQLKQKWQYFFMFIVGGLIGFFPIVLFEVRHQFYNTQTIFLFARQILTNSQFHSGGLGFAPHYVLSLFFAVTCVLCIVLRKKITAFIAVTTSIIVFIYALIAYFPTPTHAFGMPRGWNFGKEEKVASIIQNQKLENYTVANLTYETLASVQKYLIFKNNNSIALDKFDNYQTNTYLFVIATPQQLQTTQSYEVVPLRSSIQKTWELGDDYQLFLLERK
jgi:hypothetical protein